MEDVSAHGVLTHLGPMPVARFMREVWGRRPLLVRQAFPGLRPPVTRSELFALAAREDVESRLVRRDAQGWHLEHGPFARRRLPGLRTPHWTLLVQGVDLAHEAAHRLLARFRFVPDARLDDLMISWASDGGGVGPHVDNYDVFLIQVEGRRRWRISRQRDLALLPDVPLKLLARFRPTSEWVLEPGDLLYLPPGVAHDGVAEGPCMTCSVGFRAPTFSELLEPWQAAAAEHARLPGRVSDAGRPATRHAGKLPPELVTQVHAALSRHRPSPADTERFLLAHLSEPKPQVVFEAASRGASPAVFARQCARAGLGLDRRSRLLTGRGGLGINGEWLAWPQAGRAILARLADRRALSPQECRDLPAPVLALLANWAQAGWLHCGASPGRASA
ncbi:MAG TPA: cupin domain-containing protein [Burkholderiaceae bacterium]|nr:cupin domain-containing protein [Burkholderiaceae bacterium]